MSDEIRAPDEQWIATCEEAGEYGNDESPLSLVFLLRHWIDHQAAIRAFSAWQCEVTDPDGVATAATGPVLFFQYHPALFAGAPPPRPGLYRFTWDGLQQDGLWVRLASGEHVAGDRPRPRVHRRKMAIFGRRSEKP